MTAAMPMTILRMGSIDPYQVFRIFHEIRFSNGKPGTRADIAYMIDQSHNLKGKIEAMIQTVTVAQELFAKAALVDYERFVKAQQASDLIRAESCLQDAFAYRCPSGIFANGESLRGLPEDPMEAFRKSGYLDESRKSGASRNLSSVSSYV